MRTRIPLVAVLALFVAVSCDQQLVEPADDQVVEAPAFNYMNNPDNGNPKVFRFEHHWMICFSDAENGLTACHSTLQFDGGNEPDCGLQQLGDPVAHQDVGNLDAEDWKAIHQGEVFITILDENTAGNCVGYELVAEGFGRLTANDNDLWGLEPGSTNANTWRFRGHGKLGDYVYNGHLQVICWPNHPDRTCEEKSVMINLH